MTARWRTALIAQALEAQREIQKDAKAAEKLAASICRILRSAPNRHSAIEDIATKLSRHALRVAAHASIYEAAWSAIEQGD